MIKGKSRRNYLEGNNNAGRVNTQRRALEKEKDAMWIGMSRTGVRNAIVYHSVQTV